MQSYPIYLRQNKAGEVDVSREGLYYRFRCRCRLPAKPIYCATLRCSGQEISLGICVPDGKLFVADRRIPSKLINKGEFEFYLTEKHKQPDVTIPVESQKPFQYLEHLENAYFSRSGDTAQICIQEIKSPDPDQRDSDQNL